MSSIEERVEAVERKVAEIADLRAERDHWIGEAKKFERYYNSAYESRMRYYRQLKEARLL